MDSSVLNHPIISERYFFPQPCKFDSPFWVERDGVRLGCYYQHNHPAAKTMIHFHGNGETVDDYLIEFAGVIDRFGYNLILAEFRGYGMSSGEPELGEMLADVSAVVEQSGLKQEEIVFFGRSVGSLMAVHGLSLYPNVAGIILESGIANPVERILLRIRPAELGLTEDELVTVLKTELNQRDKMGAYKGSVLVMHTWNDGLVDVSHGKRLYDWAGGEQKELKLFDRGDHNNIMMVNAKEYFSLVQKFLEDC